MRALLLLAICAIASQSCNSTEAAGEDPPADHGGTNNTVNGRDSFIGGGNINQVWDDYGTIGGGRSNDAGSRGDDDTSNAAYATVGGGYRNTASGTYSTVGGGRSNEASRGSAAIGGGHYNQASGEFSTVDGGSDNIASGKYSAVGGGLDNVASGNFSTVGGGGAGRELSSEGGYYYYGNEASGTASTVAGGTDNAAIATSSTVGGGNSNEAEGQGSAVSGGGFNRAGGTYSAVGGGRANWALGLASTVAGGWRNSADGDYSFVAGMEARDLGHAHSFVWAGRTGARTSADADTFNVWSQNGIYLNGAVHAFSDRNMKEAFSFVSAREVLDKVVELPLTAWRFKSEDESVRHIGPMAQDFAATFGYGVDDTHITSTDADGVALAAIQGLYAMQREKDEQITALRWHNAQLQATLRARDESLEVRFARLEKAILRDRLDAPARSLE